MQQPHFALLTCCMRHASSSTSERLSSSARSLATLAVNSAICELTNDRLGAIRRPRPNHVILAYRVYTPLSELDDDGGEDGGNSSSISNGVRYSGSSGGGGSSEGNRRGGGRRQRDAVDTVNGTHIEVRGGGTTRAGWAQAAAAGQQNVRI